jgi:hypothetical protein
MRPNEGARDGEEEEAEALVHAAAAVVAWSSRNDSGGRSSAVAMVFVLSDTEQSEGERKREWGGE